MLYEVIPASKFKCTVNVPGSKSVTNRALILSAYSHGEVVLNNVLFSDDTVYMIEALNTLGIKVEEDRFTKKVFVRDIPTEPLRGKCFIGNAGTAMRFLTSFISAKGGNVELTGVERMKNRPIGELVNILRNLGVKIDYLENEGFPPIFINSSGLKGGKIKIKGDISSQFISSILLSAPYADTDIYLEIEGDLISKPYIDITVAMMEEFGVKTENYDYRNFYVRAGQTYKRSEEYTVESDCSSASYFFGAAAIANGDITVDNINPDSLQGDIRFIDILERMGAKVERGSNYVRVVGSTLKGISVDMNDISDVAPTLAVVALFAEGPTEIKNVANMRIKETDRIKALREQLIKLGATVEEKEDGLIIYPSNNYQSADIDTYNDHRMAMSFTMAGLKIPGIRIKDPGCVSKTFPNFYNEFGKIYKQEI